jgi:hypothetical protein
MNREIMQQVLCIIKLLRTHDNEQATEKLELISAFEKELAKREQEPKLTDAGADTNITRGLEPKGSGMVTLHQVGMRVDLKDAPPRKEWVGLTFEEFKFIAGKYLLSTSVGFSYFHEEIENRFKELNT